MYQQRQNGKELLELTIFTQLPLLNCQTMSRNTPIRSWGQFDRKIRFSGCKLLGELDRFGNSILVAGCQRSGTTALSRLLTESKGMVKFQFGRDDELDAAQILSGWVPYPSNGRFCFQTTYLNDSYPEYCEHTNYKLIWVLRNPHSVIYSMLHNWKRGALNRLFRHCGQEHLSESENWKYEHMGAWAINRLRKACLSYNAKISQTATLISNLGRDRIMVIDYDELINNKVILPKIYSFASLQYREEYLSRLHTKSLTKSDNFSDKESKIIESVCMPFYLQARNYLSNDPA
jgi:hypothetical protein